MSHKMKPVKEDIMILREFGISVWKILWKRKCWNFKWKLLMQLRISLHLFNCLRLTFKPKEEWKTNKMKYENLDCVAVENSHSPHYNTTSAFLWLFNFKLTGTEIDLLRNSTEFTNSAKQCVLRDKFCKWLIQVICANKILHTASGIFFATIAG